MEVRADAGPLRRRWWGWGGERQTEDRKGRDRVGRVKGVSEEAESVGMGDGEVDNVGRVQEEESSDKKRVESGKQTWFGRRVVRADSS